MISLIIFPVHSKGLESKSDQITESEFEIYDYVENPILTLFNLKLDVLSQETRYYTPCSQKHTHFEFSSNLSIEIRSSTASLMQFGVRG